MSVEKPKGVAFYSIKSGETMYARSEAQIQAFINSSDMGVNASRDQDFGWRLGKEWVELVRKYRNNEEKMDRLTEKAGGNKPTVPQILYAIYGEHVRAYQQQLEDNATPYEEEYLESISSRPRANTATAIENESVEEVDDKKTKSTPKK